MDPLNFVVPLNPILVSKKFNNNYSELTTKVNYFGSLLRDTLFYPLFDSHENDEKNYRLLQNEEAYYKRFWTGREPLDLNLENGELIRKNYVVKDQPIVIQIEAGKKITSLCRIIESKNCPEENVFNALLIPGNLSKLNNNLMVFYDLLDAHSKDEKTSPARFFIFGHYEMTIEENGIVSPYKPPTLDAVGEVLKRTLESLQEKYGSFNFIYGHSLGCIVLSSLLKISGPELLPALIHFDRGPTSLSEASQNYMGSWLLNLIGKYSGLAFNIDKAIKKFFKRCYEIAPQKVQKSSCLITGVENDLVFQNKSNLALNNTLNKLKRMNFPISNLIFSPPSQVSHERAHHSWRLMHFNTSYLTPASQANIEMLPKENLAQMMLRIARPKN